MPLGLVANYSDSDESEDEESQEKSQAVGTVKTTDEVDKNGKAEDELEDFVKKVNYGEQIPEKPKPVTLSSLSSIRKKTKSGKIQITIPEILGSDSDDDEPVRKVQKITNSGPSGLLGFLPHPKNSSTLGQPTKANKTFLPQSLTRPNKVTDENYTIKSNRGKFKQSTANKHKLQSTYSDSDSEGETNPSFFSLENNSNPQTSTTSSYFGLGETEPNVSEPSTSASIVTRPEYQAQPTAASLYNLAVLAEDKEPHINDSGASYGGIREEDLINSEEFLKMQGKKQRGKEDIQFIEVNTDDLKATELEITKNMSQDIDPSMYEHRKTMNITRAEKNKHQITYLAYQAKERELELKNSWAEGRANRQAAQSRYGF